MPRGKTKAMCFKIGADFNPETDTPLRYFSIKETFVRNDTPENYKLYCGESMVMYLQRDGFIYKYPSYKPEHEPYVEAFVRDYAPHVSYYKVKTTLSTHKPLYIGLPNLVTV